jgi:hypothetical protein
MTWVRDTLLLLLIVFMTHALTWEMQDARWLYAIKQVLNEFDSKGKRTPPLR